jgi:hypothetical protein
VSFEDGSISKLRNSLEEISHLQTPKPLSKAVIFTSENKTFLAGGGKENDLFLHDIEAKQTIWKAKNVQYSHYSENSINVIRLKTIN